MDKQSGRLPQEWAARIGIKVVGPHAVDQRAAVRMPGLNQLGRRLCLLSCFSGVRGRSP